MNKIFNGDGAIGAPGSDARERQYDEIAKAQAEAILELPEGHTYGSTSMAAKFVEAFIEGAKWQRHQLNCR